MINYRPNFLTKFLSIRKVQQMLNGILAKQDIDSIVQNLKKEHYDYLVITDETKEFDDKIVLTDITISDEVKSNGPVGRIAYQEGKILYGSDLVFGKKPLNEIHFADCIGCKPVVCIESGKYNPEKVYIFIKQCFEYGIRRSRTAVVYIPKK